MVEKNKEKTENLQEKEEEMQQPNVNPSNKRDKEAKKKKTTTSKKETTELSKEKLKKENQELAAGLNEWKDKYLRLAAEFDNYRKRTLNEKIELTKTAEKDILNDFMTIMDDFDRAVVSMEKVKDTEALKAGLDLIYNKCISFLKKNGVKEIEAKEKEFNTDEHEAVSKINAPNDELKGKVLDVIQKGYYLNDSILRYARVVVGE